MGDLLAPRMLLPLLAVLVLAICCCAALAAGCAEACESFALLRGSVSPARAVAKQRHLTHRGDYASAPPSAMGADNRDASPTRDPIKEALTRKARALRHEALQGAARLGLTDRRPGQPPPAVWELQKLRQLSQQVPEGMLHGGQVKLIVQGPCGLLPPRPQQSELGGGAGAAGGSASPTYWQRDVHGAVWSRAQTTRSAWTPQSLISSVTSVLSHRPGAPSSSTRGYPRQGPQSPESQRLYRAPYSYHANTSPPVIVGTHRGFDGPLCNGASRAAKPRLFEWSEEGGVVGGAGAAGSETQMF